MSAAGPSACPALCACWKPRTASMAACPGRGCSQPAIAAAEQGFPVSARLAAAIAAARPAAPRSRRARRYFCCPTARRCRPAACCATRPSPRRCAPSRRRARDALHRGPIAEAIVAAVRQPPGQSRLMTAGGPGRLRAPAARGDLRALPRRPGLRLPAALLGRRRVAADPRHARRIRTWRRLDPRGLERGASAGRGEPPRLRRPQPLPGR